MRLVLASNNAAKLAELSTVLAPLGVQLLAQGMLGVTEAEEPHATFIENALAKARHAAQASGLAAVADDSGLVVRALGGLPGVVSSHYAPCARAPGEDREAFRARQDAANNAHLLAELASQADRAAHFTCVLVAVRHAGDPEPLVASGHWGGRILQAPQGGGGFGYDPLLGLADGRSAAQLSRDEKNAVSHRAQAAAALVDLLRARWL
ncbi:MAG: RdgB/HAM1 family non-canonical purine NTP pyrophosphatase [Proteobacteria bacterium]|nr:RdgB/HAM1 family non-canonical purine NTP pyrophosphatase [Pseudomonadota bacterium]